jgi:hypothetical protein
MFKKSSLLLFPKLLVTRLEPWNFNEADLRSTHKYRKSKIDCLRFVMCPLLTLIFQGFFLQWPLKVLLKQKMQAVCAFKLTYLLTLLLRCLWFYHCVPPLQIKDKQNFHQNRLKKRKRNQNQN